MSALFRFSSPLATQGGLGLGGEQQLYDCHMLGHNQIKSTRVSSGHAHRSLGAFGFFFSPPPPPPPPPEGSATACRLKGENVHIQGTYAIAYGCFLPLSSAFCCASVQFFASRVAGGASSLKRNLDDLLGLCCYI